MAEAEQEAAPEMEQIEEAAGGEIAVNDEEPKDLMNEDENEDANEEENEQEVAEEAEGVSGDPGDAVDTTAEFLKIFQGKTEFSSWEEFNTLFEEFQRETGSAFKPKSATSIEFANERRVRDIIPAHFVYQTVKMVCQNFGTPTPVARDGSTRKPRKYVGLGCEAMVHLRYKAGTLNIVSCNLEHKNHALFSGNEVIRKVRSFSFTDDIDHLMAKVVMEHNPFSHWNSEKEWMALVADLQSRDSRMKTVTVRVVKKRIRFLIDRYMANSSGKAPLPDDEMGIILYELAKAKQDAMDNITKVPRKPGARKRGRPRKYPRPESEEDEELEAMLDADDSANYSPDEKRAKRYASSTSYSSAPSGPPPIKDIAVFLRYMERKDDNDRRLKQDDIDLRRGELELHKKELELQRERFEFERLERQAHLDLLKAQLEVLTSQRTQQQQQQQKLVLADPKGDGSGVTEYTIVVNNDQAFATQ